MNIKKRLDDNLQKQQAQKAHEIAKRMVRTASELGENARFDPQGFTPEMIGIITRDLSAKGLKLEKTPEGHFRVAGDASG